MFRREAAREAGDGKVEAAPEEMHWAAFPEETGTEALEHRFDAAQRGVQAFGGVRIIVAGRDIFRKGRRARNLVRPVVEVRWQAMRFEHEDQAAMQGGDAAYVERQ